MKDHWIKTASGMISFPNLDTYQKDEFMTILESGVFLEDYGFDRDNGIVIFKEAKITCGDTKMFLDRITRIARPREGASFCTYDSNGCWSKWVYQNDRWQSMSGYVYYPEEDDPSYEDLIILYNRLRK